MSTEAEGRVLTDTEWLKATEDLRFGGFSHRGPAMEKLRADRQALRDAIMTLTAEEWEAFWVHCPDTKCQDALRRLAQVRRELGE